MARQTHIAQLIANPAGYAFARRLDGQGSIFIPPHRLGDAVDGDEVEVTSWPAERGDEGRVVSVRARQRRLLVGILEKQGNRRHSLACVDSRILPSVRVVDGLDRARPQQLVAARIVGYPGEDGSEELRVSIERAFEDATGLETHVQMVLAEQGVSDQFPPAVTTEATRVPDAPTDEDIEGRIDLRRLPFMTIDPVDARDFDDAVCVELMGDDADADPMCLRVAVADVTHYVRPGSAIDDEAQQRCFSCYLPHRAIPMLPEELSSGVCSLVPRQDRLAMVVEMVVDASGEVHRPKVLAAVIHSHERLTYEQAAVMMPGAKDEGATDVAEFGPDVVTRVADLARVSSRLRGARLRRGAVELALPETKIVLDADDPTRIRDVVETRADPGVSRAYNLIEELMVAANEAVGSLAVKHELPVVYRAHDEPEQERLETFALAAGGLGIEVDPEKLSSPRGVQKLMGRIAHHDRALALSGLMLRTMAQADYRSARVGHFALASPAYVHFTSPIRRYADVISHRVMKAFLSGRGLWEPPADEFRRLPEPRVVTEMAMRCSLRERSVVQAERNCKATFAASFMLDRIGEEFDARIAGLSSAAMFIAIENPRVDGAIALESLGKRDPYELDESGVAVVGRRSGHRWLLGDSVRVRIAAIDVARRRIELEMRPRRSRSSE